MLDLDLLVSSFSALSVDFLFWLVAFLTVLNLVGSLKSKLDPWFKYIIAYRSEYFGLTNLDCNLATFRCIFLSFSVLSCCRTRILTVFFFGKYSSNGFGIFDWIKNIGGEQFEHVNSWHCQLYLDDFVFIFANLEKCNVWFWTHFVSNLVIHFFEWVDFYFFQNFLSASRTYKNFYHFFLHFLKMNFYL